MMCFLALFQNHLWLVNTPFPFLADRSFIPSPAEGAPIGAADAGCHLHALVAHDAIKFELVTAAFSVDHILGPAAGLDSAVAAHNPVLLLFKFCFRFRC